MASALGARPCAAARTRYRSSTRRAWRGVRGASGDEPVAQAAAWVGGAADPHRHWVGRDGRHDRLVHSIGAVGGHGLAGEEAADDVQAGLEAGRAPGVVRAHPGELLLVAADGAREDEPTGCERRQRAHLLGDQYRVPEGQEVQRALRPVAPFRQQSPEEGEFWYYGTGVTWRSPTNSESSPASQAARAARPASGRPTARRRRR